MFVLGISEPMYFVQKIKNLISVLYVYVIFFLKLQKQSILSSSAKN